MLASWPPVAEVVSTSYISDYGGHAKVGTDFFENFERKKKKKKEEKHSPRNGDV